MAKRKTDDFIKENPSIKEGFNYNETSDPYKENFVYHFEDNKISQTNESFVNDVEENQGTSHLNEENKESTINRDIQDKIGESAGTSSAAGGTVAGASAGTAAGGVVQTVAVATATTVVVAAGGLAFYQSTVEKAAAFINDIVLTDYTLNFNLTLSIDDNGNIVESDKEIGNDCTVVVELSCASYTDEFEVKKYGLTGVTFNNLIPETEYTIDVYQKSFLGLEDLDKFSCLKTTEPIKFVTDPVTPEPVDTRSITFDAEEDPVGGLTIYSQINYEEDTSYYSDYELHFFKKNRSLNDNDVSFYMTLDSQNPFARQALHLSSYTSLLSGTFDVTLEAFSTNPDDIATGGVDGGGTSGRDDGVYVELFTRSINFDDVLASRVILPPAKKVYLQRIYGDDSSNGYKYRALVGIDEADEEYYTEPSISVYPLDYTNPISRFNVDKFNQLFDADISWGQDTTWEWSVCEFALNVISHKQEDVDRYNEDPEVSVPVTTDVGVAIEVYRTTIDLANDPVWVYEQTEPEIYSEDICFSASMSYFSTQQCFVDIPIYDPGNYLSNFQITIMDEFDSSNTQLFDLKTSTGTILLEEFNSSLYVIDGANPGDYSNGTFSYQITAQSSFGLENGNLQSIVVGTGTIDSGTFLNAMEFDGAVNVTYEEASATVQGNKVIKFNVNLGYMDTSAYSSFEVEFDKDGDGEDILSYSVTSYEQSYSTSITEKTGVYKVTTYGYDATTGYKKVIFVEMIDFDNVQDI